MTNVLLDDGFNVSKNLACRFGFGESFVLQQLGSRLNPDNWFSMPLVDWRKLDFPFFSNGEVKSYLKSLIAQNAVLYKYKDGQLVLSICFDNVDEFLGERTDAFCAESDEFFQSAYREFLEAQND